MEHKKMSREEIATAEIRKTDISKRNQKILLAFFLIFIMSAAVIQLISNISRAAETSSLTMKNDQIVDASAGFFKNMTNFNTNLLSNIKQFETDLEDNSVFRKTIIPITQTGLVQIFNTGNENAWLSKDNFYYKFSNQYLTQAGFLDTKQLNKREENEEVQPNPVKAILDFKEKLAKRNIQLIIIPAPPKASFVLKNSAKAINNKSYATFVKQLQNEGIVVCDVFSLLEKQNLENSGYLKYDTHWSPEAMKIVANEVSKLLDSLSIPKGNTNYNTKKATIENYGDIVDMLNIENKNAHFKTQSIEIEQVLGGNYLFKPSAESDILFLGDSYANIYSFEGMNWGSSAGLSEHISHNMNKPVDRILMNDAGAYATRLSLSNDLKRGRDRLAGKKVLILEFAARELSVGDWKILDMKLNEDYESEFFVPKEETSVTVTGIVRETSKVPLPNTVPYKDHVFSIHITDLKDSTGNELGESVVYVSSMENNNWTDAAKLRNGQEITLKLYNWHEYADKFGSINRSELQDDDLSLEDPCWGILIKK
ncbi:hypothetical protein IMCC3317_09590 [Kordia antarctica]|uniref:AlgX/AlgJ SGNH hydrolase-like domain-containing protein n=1 Tax=Kordia antarctica TaxID=1218801 RepID=A0A7L4ZFZ7_9FLAO|nr:hypothetical protein [Kordia antarctica]QHI35613.1 hypothetical protein IMCC3317_09590 [Kordia antarctica]